MRTLSRATVCAVTLLLGASASSLAQARKTLYDSTANARADVQAALARARVDHKRVLLDFGADWCVDCRVLDTLMRAPSNAAVIREQFHVVTIDVGYTNRNLDVSAEYGAPIEGGIPAVVVLTPDGKPVASTKDGALENARTMTPADLAVFLSRWTRATPTTPPDHWALSSFTANDVAVAFTLQRAPDGTLTLVGTFTPTRAGFHLYSKDLPVAGLDGIGRPTLITPVKMGPRPGPDMKTIVTSPLKAAGPLVADKVPVNLAVASLGRTFPVYPPGPVTLRLPITVAPGLRTIWVSVTYEACSDSVCLAPIVDRQVELSLPLAAR